MKRIFTLVVVFMVLSAGLVQAQVQRKVLLEHFTQASCGPCATYNPAMQAIVNANPDKIVAIKYQVWWPGSDPMYNHNTADVQARVNYYPPSFGVPHSQIDGAWWGGHPANWTINTINTRYAMTSPFEVNITHSIPPTHDTVFVRMVIRAPQAFSGSAVAHIVVEEEHIHFATAPGSNGETDFHNVMKKMLPSNAGTALPSSWAAGDSVVINTFWKTANVYDWEEIAVVGFVQDPVTKYVHQAEYSPPLPPAPLFNYDVATLEISGLPKSTCQGEIAPVVKIKNLGANNLTSLNIHYQVNGGTVNTYAWTGNLPFYSETTINLPSISFPVQAANTLKVYPGSPNGQQDQFAANDTLTESIDGGHATTNNVTLTLRTDNAPAQTTWTLKDASGNTVYSGGPYSQNQTIFTVPMTLPGSGCYIFTINDAGGNGICCTNGIGFYRITDQSGLNFIAGSNFSSVEVNEFEVLPVGVEEELIAASVVVRPNPFRGEANLMLDLPARTEVSAEMFDLLGNRVMVVAPELKARGKSEVKLDGQGLPPGLYLLKVLVGAELHTLKINLIR